MTFDQISIILAKINDYYFYNNNGSIPHHTYEQLISDLKKTPELKENFHFIYEGGLDHETPLEIKGRWAKSRPLLFKLFGHKLILCINGSTFVLLPKNNKIIELTSNALIWFNAAFILIEQNIRQDHEQKHVESCSFLNLDLMKYLIRGYQLLKSEEGTLLFQQNIQFFLESYQLSIRRYSDDMIYFSISHISFKVTDVIALSKIPRNIFPKFQWNTINSKDAYLFNKMRNKNMDTPSTDFYKPKTAPTRNFSLYNFLNDIQGFLMRENKPKDIFNFIVRMLDDEGEFAGSFEKNGRSTTYSIKVQKLIGDNEVPYHLLDINVTCKIKDKIAPVLAFSISANEDDFELVIGALQQIISFFR